MFLIAVLMLFSKTLQQTGFALVNKAVSYAMRKSLYESVLRKSIAWHDDRDNAAGVIGNMLNVKPVISPLKDGAKKIATLHKRYDQFTYALRMLSENLKGRGGGLVMLEYTDNEAWVRDTVLPAVCTEHPKAEVIVKPMSLTSGVHMGPGTWAVACLPPDGEDFPNEGRP